MVVPPMLKDPTPIPVTMDPPTTAMSFGAPLET
jgi:hypothetical protein